MRIRCPLCNKEESFWRDVTFWNWGRENTISWATHGGGRAICYKCLKNRMPEIKRHNSLYYRSNDEKKDPNCEHKWVHPYPARWCCTKCTAEYNWMCGCGGSQYVCETHYESFKKHMIEKYDSIEQYLCEKAW